MTTRLMLNLYRSILGRFETDKLAYDCPRSDDEEPGASCTVLLLDAPALSLRVSLLDERRSLAYADGYRSRGTWDKNPRRR